MSDVAGKNVAGWDIGGAHVKLALFADNNLSVLQWYCPLWRGIHELKKILDLALQEMNGKAFNHNVTMTGELVDCFSSKADGVQKIVHTFVSVMSNADNI